jgi:catechol 2,3-dioxygenase-like lactoylglutathione lyase family enzyme
MRVSAPFEPAIVASNMQAMLGFYRDVLGMSLFSLDQIAASQAQAAGLSSQGYTIARLESSGGDRLKIVAPLSRPLPHQPGPEVLQRHGLAYLTFIVPDVREIIAVLRQAGTTVSTGSEPIAFRPGIVELAFAQDPEGNYIEFVQRNDLSTYRPARGGTHL